MSQDFKLELDDDEEERGLGGVGKAAGNESDDYNDDSFEKTSPRVVEGMQETGKQ